jgi:peptidylprolyl isomerase
MTAAKRGDTVRVHYRGSLSDGTVFDASEGRDPLQFAIGAGQVIPGFDQAVEGLCVGDRRTLTIPCAEAYGPHHEELMATVPRHDLPKDIHPEVGDEYQVNQPGQPPLVVRVAALTADTITLDGNHPLAGQDLTFDIHLVEVL